MNQIDRQRLQSHHQHLDEEIRHMVQRGWTDSVKLQQLKKQKLAIKDQLHQIVLPADHRSEAA